MAQYFLQQADTDLFVTRWWLILGLASGAYSHFKHFHAHYGDVTAENNASVSINDHEPQSYNLFNAFPNLPASERAMFDLHVIML